MISRIVCLSFLICANAIPVFACDEIPNLQPPKPQQDSTDHHRLTANKILTWIEDAGKTPSTLARPTSQSPFQALSSITADEFLTFFPLFRDHILHFQPSSETESQALSDFRRFLGNWVYETGMIKLNIVRIVSHKTDSALTVYPPVIPADAGIHSHNASSMAPRQSLPHSFVRDILEIAAWRDITVLVIPNILHDIDTAFARFKIPLSFSDKTLEGLSLALSFIAWATRMEFHADSFYSAYVKDHVKPLVPLSLPIHELNELGVLHATWVLKLNTPKAIEGFNAYFKEALDVVMGKAVKQPLSASQSTTEDALAVPNFDKLNAFFTWEDGLYTDITPEWVVTLRRRLQDEFFYPDGPPRNDTLEETPHEVE